MRREPDESASSMAGLSREIKLFQIRLAAKYSALPCKPFYARRDLTVRMETVLTLRATDGGGAGTNASSEFEVIVQTYRPRVFRFLLASVRDRESAENLTQDCFLRAYRARDQFRGESSRATWLMQIAINLVRKPLSSSRLQIFKASITPGAGTTRSS